MNALDTSEVKYINLSADLIMSISNKTQVCV